MAIFRKSTMIKIANILLLLFIIAIGYYIITYQLSHNNEHFAAEKVAGTTTIKQGNETTIHSDDKVKLVNASEDDNKPNEINAPFKSSPSAVKPAKPQQIDNAPEIPPTKPPPESADLTPKEKQLFDAFLSKRITDDKIHELIESGILTEQLVEKFLSMVDNLPEGPPVSRAPKKQSIIAAADKKDANLLEGFCGNNYARANSF
jgi:hypothetical protein